MANRYQTPRTQYFANPVTGAPLVGGQLFFYANNTTTPQNTYSDPGLTIANTNPVVLNANGQPSVDIFLQNLSYTVVLQDANNNTLWSANNVYTSDFSTVAVFGSYAGNPNGFVAGTAGSGTTNASVIWDYVDDILYVCTATGNAASAVWTGINTTAPASTIPVPQGYLTLTSQTPILTADTTSTSVFYTPYNGNLCPIWNGSSFTNSVFSELTLTLTAGVHVASTIYDVFIFNNSGVITVGTGPAWNTSTAGAGARGSGAGTTQISRQNGILTNTNTIVLKNGANTYSNIAANQATYVGSIFIDTVAGQITCHRSWGQSRKWGVWNMYSRAPVILQVGDPTGSWVDSNASIHVSNNNVANSCTVFSGLAEDEYNFNFVQTQQPGATSAGTPTTEIFNLIGWNSVTAGSGTKGNVTTSTASASPLTVNLAGTAVFVQTPQLGINVVSCLETVANANGTHFGGQANMQLTAVWRA